MELTFGIGIAGIEWNSIGPSNGGVKITLHVVNRLWDKLSTE